MDFRAAHNRSDHGQYATLAMRLWQACLGTIIFVWTAGAYASASGSVAVIVEGTGGEAVRSDIVAALPSGITVIDDNQKLVDALSKRQVDDVGGALLAAPHHDSLAISVRKAAEAAHADAVILGATRPHKGKKGTDVVVVVVIAGQDAAAVDQTVLLGKAATRRDQWKKILGPALGDLHAQAEPSAAASSASPAAEPASKEGDSEKKEPAPSSDKAEQTPEVQGPPATINDAMFVASLALDFGGRQFHYNQRVTNDNLRPYDLPTGVLLPVTPGIVGTIEAYPLAKSQGVLRDIGVSARASTDFAKVQVGSETKSTEWYAWEVNLRGRIPLGPRESAPFLGVEGGIGQLMFGFSDTGAIANILPSVDYTYVRLGADARLPLGKLALIAGAAYRIVLGAGDLQNHFPHEQVGGLDAHVGAALSITKNIEARLNVSYVRFWETFNPHVGDTYQGQSYVAGGGLDQFINANLGAAIFF